MALPPSFQATVTPTIYTYTEDLPRPSCPDCGSPVLVPDSVGDPTSPWEGSCSGGHSATYQLEQDEEVDILCFRGQLWASSEEECYFCGELTVYAESPEQAEQAIIEGGWFPELHSKAAEPVVAELEEVVGDQD